MGPSRPTLSRSAQATLFLLSLIISLVFIAFDPIVNPDAVTYLLSAEKYLEGGLAAAMAIHDWPFYAALIATTHQLTGLGLLHAAWLLNSIFLALLPLAIVQLCSNAGGTLRAQYFSAALVLLLPAVNDHRADLIRDLGYWCMMLWALAGLASYLRQGGGILSWQWLIAALAATLFRAEAIILLLAVPIIVMAMTARAQDRAAIVASRAVLPGVAVFILIILLPLGADNCDPTTQAGYQCGGRIQSLWQNAMVLGEQFQHRASEMGDKVLNPYFAEHTGLAVLAGLTMLALATLVTAISLPIALIVTFGLIQRRAILNPESTRIITATVCVCLLLLLGLATLVGFLQTRYAVLPALCLLPVAAITLDTVLTQTAGETSFRAIATAIALLFVYYLAEGLFSLGGSNTYLTDATEWIENNSAADARVYSNDPRLPYLSKRRFNWSDIREYSATHLKLRKVPEGYDYYALRVRRGTGTHSAAVGPESGLVAVQKFANRKGDKVIIYVPLQP